MSQFRVIFHRPGGAVPSPVTTDTYDNALRVVLDRAQAVPDARLSVRGVDEWALVWSGQRKSELIAIEKI